MHIKDYIHLLAGPFVTYVVTQTKNLSYLSELEGLAVASYHGDHGQHEGLAGIVSKA